MRFILLFVFATMLLFATIPVTVYAVPASPRFAELKQPDGSTFAARQWGDENSHGWETSDGHTVILDQPSKRWMYATHDTEGNLISSTLPVNGLQKAPADLKKKLRPVKKSLIRSINKPESSSSSIAPQAAAPVTGTKNLPVILVGFKDVPFTKTNTDFENLLFGTTGKSMSDYYKENSYNQLTVTGGPQGVWGPVTSNQNRIYYGQNDTSGNDLRPGTLVYEAVSKAAAGGFKFAPFVDQTKSCYVDVVVIAHQGTGEEAGFDVNDIWSHSWNLNSAKAFGDSNGEFVTTESCSYQGGGGYIKVNNYVIQPELATPDPNGLLIGIGVYAHEYGHALGLPDLYDTDGSSEGAGNWTLMAGGSWLGPATPFTWNSGNYTTHIGDVPSHLDAWSKYYLGWITPTNITGVNASQTVVAASSSSANFYTLGTGTPTSGEYFLVENRQNTGFDSYLDGNGLLIWHIDGTTISNLFGSNSINNNECKSKTAGDCSGANTHYGVALVQADNNLHLENNTNRGDANDPYRFPYSFTDLTTPGSKWWSGAASAVSVTTVSSSQTNMTADLAFGSGTPIAVPDAPTIGTATAGNASATITFTPPAFDGGSPITGYTVTSNPGNITATGASSPITIFGLTNDTSYNFTVKATNAAGNSIASAASNSVTPKNVYAVTFTTAPLTKSLSYKKTTRVIRFTVTTGSATIDELTKSLTTSSSWLTASIISYNSVKKTGVIKCIVSDSLNNSPRNGSVSIGGQSYTIDQLAKPAKLTVVQNPTASLPGSGGQKTVTVTVDPSDSVWSVTEVKWLPTSSPTDWLSGFTVGAEQNGGATFTLTATPNATGKARSATLTLASKDGKSKKTVTIKQTK